MSIKKRMNMDEEIRLARGTYSLDDVGSIQREVTKKESYSYSFFKRSFDLAFSFSVLITVFPILCLIIYGVKIFSPSHRYPIFFKQKRTGLNGKSFDCYKFRTMRVNAQADTKQAEKGDPRITKFGGILRKYSLDEIPQFYNVLKGNMSIVGPRPHMLTQTEQYSTIIPNYMYRHCVKPGITGFAQVTGYRGETKRLSQMVGRVQRDVWYIENRSFWLDTKIVFMTAKGMNAGA